MNKNIVLFLSVIWLLAACAPVVTPEPTETETLTPTATTTPIPTPTATATATPEPAWMTTIKTQDSEGLFFQIIDGHPVIDLYDTQSPETIVLNENSIQIVATTSGLNPNILTAQDADGNKYAFNPGHGWFKMPEVQLDYSNLAKYTELNEDDFSDDKANIIASLVYAENPTISPNALNPVIWASYNNFIQVLTLGLNTAGNLNIAQQKYSEYLKYYGTWGSDPEIKPFAWTGFFKVHLNNWQTIYVVSRTLKNPTAANQNQTINLFYGFDEATYKNMAIEDVGPGKSPLERIINSTNNGFKDFAMILVPPNLTNQFPFFPDTATLSGYVNPVVGNLQQPGLIILLFNQGDNQRIMQVLQEGQQAHALSPLLEPLPDAISEYILLPTFTSR